MSRQFLWKLLSEPPYSVSKKLIGVKKSISCNSVSKVRKGGVKTDWFDIETGVRQDDELYPLLFIIVMDKCNKGANPQQGQKAVAYADDVRWRWTHYRNCRM